MELVWKTRREGYPYKRTFFRPGAMRHSPVRFSTLKSVSGRAPMHVEHPWLFSSGSAAKTKLFTAKTHKLPASKPFPYLVEQECPSSVPHPCLPWSVQATVAIDGVAPQVSHNPCIWLD